MPLDIGLDLAVQDGAVVITGEGGALIGQGRASEGAELPEAPAPISLDEARAAGARHIGLSQRVHPICFTCGTERGAGDGLRVLAGPVEDREAGVVADAWTPHEAFADADGLTRLEVVWAALDCPGYFAWVEKEGRHGALLGTMTAEVLRRPAAGEPCVVLAWPIAREGRKETAGVALYSASGELMARAHQVWIVMGPRPPIAQPATETASA
ncbi:hypothetical protein [Phenylobacterium sp. J367]|uniref:hypothetical protein n=1 Tax=Phenylobacterium sp. J367 TaxID=2898435 RepID=UPI0021517F35|nr:hypothetical protein [Phenylobacterium sp. J367]MCR5880888.1 hypothetical protein [Phenylobacterium sp. J367]